MNVVSLFCSHSDPGIPLAWQYSVQAIALDRAYASGSERLMRMVEDLQDMTRGTEGTHRAPHLVVSSGTR